MNARASGDRISGHGQFAPVSESDREWTEPLPSVDLPRAMYGGR